MVVLIIQTSTVFWSVGHRPVPTSIVPGPGSGAGSKERVHLVEHGPGVKSGAFRLFNLSLSELFKPRFVTGFEVVKFI